MEALVSAVESYGPILLFALGFIEYVGVPIASVPFLVAAGALARMDAIPFALVVPLAAAGGLAADALWYGLGRRGGNRLVGAACSLSPNPSSCVTVVQERVLRLGAGYILTAKFLPGVGNLIAPAAGLGKYPASRFLAWDALALLMWAGAYSGLGWVFSNQVESLITALDAYTSRVLMLGVALVALSVLYRYMKARRHGHGEA